MFKTLTPGQCGPAQAVGGVNLTIDSHTGGNTETCLAGTRVDAPLANPRRNKIGG
jgi:hypothetical protein